MKKSTTITTIVFSVLSAGVPSCYGFGGVGKSANQRRQQHLQQQQQQQSSVSVPALEMSASSSDLELDRRSLLIAAGGILSSSLIIDVNNNNDNDVSNNGIGIGKGNNYRAVAAEIPTTTAKKPFPTWTLANNVEMPVMAMNTVGMSAEDTARACEIAAANGFRHFDFHPGKETEGVARFLKTTKIPRSELFLTTKIRKPPVGISPEDAAAAARAQIDENLAAIGGYADMLMTRDSPDQAVMQAQWKVLEEALRDGKTRSVGVVNFCEDSIRCLAKVSKVRPAVDYYYYHVGMNTGRTLKLRDFLDRFRIRTFAYGAIGEPGPYADERILENPILQAIGDSSKVYNARNHGPGDKSTAEIAVKWVIESGNAVSVRPTADFGLGKSFCGAAGGECEEGLRKRGELFDWNLTGEEVFKLTNIPALKSDDNPTLFSSSGCPGERPIP